jgi:hypothetical protein
MRLPFFGPRRDEVAATATDLITRFGLRAHDEASHLAELSARLRSRRHRVLYELVAREIDESFAEAQKRLGLRQSASGTARLAYPYAKDTKTAAGAMRLASPRIRRQVALVGARKPAASVAAV